MEIDACLISGHLEGVGFYQFFKKGGVNNIISCFHWLAEKLNVIDKDYP